MQDRIFGPFLRLQAVDGQAAEEFPSAAEIVFHGGDQQAFAESARSTEEIELSRFLHPMDILRLVDV